MLMQIAFPRNKQPSFYFDMVAYGQFNDGKIQDFIPTDEDIKRSTDLLPKF